MPGIDESREFLPLRVVVLSMSDTRDLDTDKSGKLLEERAGAAGHVVKERRVLREDRAGIEAELRRYVADDEVDVVLCTGGTGMTGRDVTPDAVEAVMDKHIPGFGELFRWLSYEGIGTSTILSRATAGLAGSTYLFALPGSTGACRDAWEKILSQQLDSRWRPCNLAELIPRLKER